MSSAYDRWGHFKITYGVLMFRMQNGCLLLMCRLQRETAKCIRLPCPSSPVMMIWPSWDSASVTLLISTGIPSAPSSVWTVCTPSGPPVWICTTNKLISTRASHHNFNQTIIQLDSVLTCIIDTVPSGLVIVWRTAGAYWDIWNTNNTTHL